MKKKITITLPKLDIMKETPEERKQRVRNSGTSMVTKIVPNKKRLTKKQQRQTNNKEVREYV